MSGDQPAREKNRVAGGRYNQPLPPCLLEEGMFLRLEFPVYLSLQREDGLGF